MYQLAFSDIEQIFRNDNLIPIVAITLGGLVALTGIVGGTIGGIVKARAREQTRREIAAYVAEGTIDADKAVEILNAGPHHAVMTRLSALGGKETKCTC